MRLPLIALGLALAGCGGGAEVAGARVQESKIPVGLGRYRTVFVEANSDDPEQQDGIINLRIALLGRLTTLVCFDHYVTGVEERDAELRISAVLRRVDGDSSAERVILGGLAPKPRVSVDVTLVDLRSGALVGKFKVEGTSSGGAATSRVTPEAFENAGIGIAEYIHEHK